MISKILGLFVNTLNAHDKYSLLYRDNLLQNLQMQFSQKQKTASQFFTTFSKPRFNSEHFHKKAHVIDDVFLTLCTPKKRGYTNV